MNLLLMAGWAKEEEEEGVEWIEERVDLHHANTLIALNQG